MGAQSGSYLLAASVRLLTSVLISSDLSHAKQKPHPETSCILMCRSKMLSILLIIHALYLVISLNVCSLCNKCADLSFCL